MNIIYVNPDEMRADVLGCYGHPLVQTPNFDRLAAEGTRFDQCHVQHTVCTPSRCAFMTGWYPHVSGHRTLWNPLQPHEPNTMRYLKQAGYDVHWFGKNDCLAPGAFASSVTNVYGTDRPAGQSPFLFERGQPGYYSFLRGPMNGPSRDELLYERATDVIRNRRVDDPPFFMFLATSFPHPTYHAPQPWHDMYNPDDLPPLRPVRGEGAPDFHALIRRYRDIEHTDEAVLRKVMAVYLGMTSYVDYLLGGLMDALEETGLADDTAIVAFSDHGDWAGDYGLVEKWPSGLDDTLTHVPLIVRVPGMEKGHVVAPPMELFDIVPTTLELVGIEAQHTHFARSQVDALRGGNADPHRAVFAEGGYDGHEPHCFEGKPSDGVAGDPNGIYYPKGLQQQEYPESVCRAHMVRTANHKLVRRSSGRHELYDLSSDPHELDNAYGRAEYDGVQHTLEYRLLNWQLCTSDVTPHEADPRGFPEGMVR
ncbi:MAG: sulfatase [Gemmatimonadetes bacterium]|nr:sulfatase [Gemmatimonadota bacterium]